MRIKPVNLLFVVAWIWMALPATAEIYQYVDDNGYVHYTNDIASVPTEKLSEIVKHKEYQGEDFVNAPAPDRKSYRSTTPNASEKSTQSRKSAQKKSLRALKESLEKEYERLMKDKSILDNDKSFQKRRKKNKYKHRPYIKALVEKEQKIEKRMAEIEANLEEINLKL